jgi:hypothetical protein
MLRRVATGRLILLEAGPLKTRPEKGVAREPARRIRYGLKAAVGDDMATIIIVASLCFAVSQRKRARREGFVLLT